MARLSHIAQDLIRLLAELKDQTLTLIEAYQSLPAILDQEDEAIKLRHLEAFQAGADAKEQLAQKAQDCIEAMSENAIGLRKLYEKHSEKTWEGDLHLSRCCQLIRDLASAESFEDLERSIIVGLLDRLETFQQEFDQLASSLKPRVEKNRAIVQRMLNHYHESYRFWMEVADEQASGYDPSGLKRGSQAHSSIQIKA